MYTCDSLMWLCSAYIFHFITIFDGCAVVCVQFSLPNGSFRYVCVCRYLSAADILYSVFVVLCLYVYLFVMFVFFGVRSIKLRLNWSSVS